MDATFWVAISFIIFFAFLIYKKIPGMITGSLDNKISEIKKKIEDVESLKIESEQLLNKYQTQLDKSKDECDIILSNAKKMNDEDTRAMEEKINSMLKSREKNITEKINQVRNKALKEVKQISTIIAVDSAKKIISQTLERNKIEEMNYESVKENLESLKKNI